MLDQWNASDRRGWAQFSDDGKLRYRLARSLTEQPLKLVGNCIQGAKRIVFLMLNPSTADAFKLDPTVNECRKRACKLGADVFEVINLFAFRSAYPKDLKSSTDRGSDARNDEAILAACKGAELIIAAWGNHGTLDAREVHVRTLLSQHNIKLHHLGFTASGNPKHPLARGKHRIPADFAPVPWTA